MSDEKIRVLCVTSHSDRPEAETFIGIKRAGLDITVMCSRRAPHYQRLVDAGIDVIPLEITHRIDRRGIEKIRSQIDATDCDVLHLFNNRAVANGLIAAQGRNVKIVAYRGIVGNESFVNPISWMRYLNPRVDRIVCVAEAVREFFLQMRFLWIRLPAKKLVRIYKGHDLDWYTDAPVDLTQFGLPVHAFVVGCVVNWRPRKGVEVLVRALQFLPRDAAIHLLLVGHMDSPNLRAQIGASPYADRIHLIGYRENAPAIAAACDVAVLPSIKREGLPKTVIEAMAYGVPPVVTDVGGSPELVANGVCGLVVPPNDARAIANAILTLYTNADLRNAMGEAARLRISTHFRIEKTIEETTALYRELAAESSGQ